MRRGILISAVLVCVMFSIAGRSFAEDKPGTTAGTAIKALIASFNAEYSDGAETTSNVLNKETVTDTITEVQNIFGIRFVDVGGQLGGNINLPISGGIGSTLSRVMVIENYGNTTDAQIHFATGNYLLQQAGGDDTSAALWLSKTGLSAPVGPYLEGDDLVVTISVVVPAGAVNGTTWNIIVSANTLSTPAGIYDGFNGENYGGYPVVTKNAVFLVAGTPYIEVITNNATLTEGKSGAGAVPGSKILYTIVLENKAPTSTAAATYLVFEQTLPNNTTYYMPAPMSYVADNGVAFDVSSANSKLIWTQNNFVSNALKIGGRVTLNYTVTID